MIAGSCKIGNRWSLDHMPVVLHARGCRFWFYKADWEEPPHIHVGKTGMEAKCRLDPISLLEWHLVFLPDVGAW